MKGKKTLIRISSLLLAAACLLCLAYGYRGFRESMDAKAYWEASGAEAEESFSLLENGILQLRENKEAYTEGVEAYEAGEQQLEAGKEELAEGAEKLAAGEETLAAGQASYDANAKLLADGEEQYQAGVAKLEAGKQRVEAGKAALADGYEQLDAAKAKLAAGEAELAAHEQEYNEGKAKLATVMPIYEAFKAAESQVKATQAAYDQAVANGDEAAALALGVQLEAERMVMNTSLAGYSMNGIIREVEEGKAQLAAYEAGVAQVEDGKRQIAEAEQKLADGEKEVAAGEAEIAAGEQQLAEARAKLDNGQEQLAAGKARLDAGKADLATGKASYEAGKQRLEDGARQLAEGLARLGEYEGGEKQVADGLDLVLGTDTYYNKAGEPLLASIADRLGEGFSYWTLDENGRTVYLNGERFLDLDKALQVVRAGRDFLADTTDLVTAEITARVELLLLTAAVCALGLLSALLGLCARRVGALSFALLGLCAAGAAIAFARLDGVEYPLCAIAGANSLLLDSLPQLDFYTALCILAGCLLLQELLTLFLRWQNAPAPAKAAPASAPVSEAPAASAPVSEMPPPAPDARSSAPAIEMPAAMPPVIPEEEVVFEQKETPAAPAQNMDTDTLAKAFAAFLQSDAFREALNHTEKKP